MLKTDLSKKVAIITGAAQGMGRSIAEALVGQGASVVICDINEEKVLSVADEIHAYGIAADVTSENDVRTLFQRVMERYGTVDILVNNAGVLRPTRFDQISKKEWDWVLDVNLNGAFLCTKAVLGVMKEKRFGRIINMSSSAGRSVSTLGGAHYTAAKAAVLGLTRAVAKEMGPYGITVNAICPGLIDTEMVRTDCSAEQIKAYEGSFPINRLGTPEEVAALVLHLVAHAPYTTGASIDINGGDLMI